MNRRQFLNAAAVSPLIAGIATTQTADTDGWIQLFNGRDLTGWYTYFPSVGKDKDPKGFVKG